mmetsp:Transcript_10565/g.36866  ORF Transcript_10565/g.36866 Transcript_10565/m.36866 type:complete len:1028 (-) Transcript_10565:220-3303(-)
MASDAATGGGGGGGGTAPAAGGEEGRGTLLDVRVYDALSGRSLHGGLHLTMDTTVSDLSARLEEAVGVPQAEQILLFGPPFTTLSSSRALVEARGKDVFVFSRAMLSKGAASAPVVRLEPQEVTVPSTPPSSTTFASSATDSASPLVRALTDYERQLLFHRQQGDALADGAHRRAASIAACSEEIQTQLRAAEAATLNLGDHAGAILRLFGSFQQHFDKQQAAQAKLLDAAEGDLAKLRDVELHPVLRVNSRQTLWDCVPVDRLRVWKERCSVSHAGLRRRTEQLAAMFEAMKAAVDAEAASSTAAAAASREATKAKKGTAEAAGSTKSEDDTTAAASPERADAPVAAAANFGAEAKLCADEARRLAEAQDARAVALRADYDGCCERVRSTAAAMPTSVSQSTDVLDACRVLEAMHQRHQSSELPDMADADAKLAAVQRRAAALKSSSTQALLDALQRISALQSNIRDLGNRLAVLREGAQQQQAAVGELRHVQCMPTAYQACIAEVARRGEYGRTYLATAEKMAERLAKLRDDEVAARERFLKRHGRHLPRDLIPGLNERPPHADIRTRAFDTMLPVITLERSGAAGGADTGAGSSGEASGASSGVMLIAAEPDWTGGEDDPAARERDLRLENAKLRAQIASLEAVNAAMAAQRELGSSDGDMSQAERRLSDEGNEESKHAQAASASSSSREETKSTGASRGSLSASSVDAPSLGGPVAVSPAIGAAGFDELRGALQIIANKVTRANLKGFDWKSPRPSSKGAKAGGGVAGDSKGSDTHDEGGAAGGAEDDGAWTTVTSRRGSRGKPAAEAGGGAGGTLPGRAGGGGAAFAPVGVGRGRVHAGGPSGRGGGGAGKGARIQPTPGLPPPTTTAPTVPAEDLTSNLSVADTLAAVSLLIRSHKATTKELARVRALLEASAGSRIAFTRFEVGDTALFLPTQEPDADSGGDVAYLAFNEGVPHCYLAPDSVAELVGEGEGEWPDYVVGRIVDLQQRTAAESDEANPFHLPPGTKYSLVKVARAGGAPRE